MLNRNIAKAVVVDTHDLHHGSFDGSENGAKASNHYQRPPGVSLPVSITGFTPAESRHGRVKGLPHGRGRSIRYPRSKER